MEGQSSTAGAAYNPGMRALLALILLVWYPLNFAAEALQTLPTIGMRGPVAALELAVHAIVAATCVAGGWSLWTGAASGPALARIALIAVAFTAVQSLYWSQLPGQTMPGDELPLALLAIAHSAAWLLYLRRSARVRSSARPSR